MPSFPDALPHGPIREAFPDVFVVTGTFRFGPGFTIPRNMTIVRSGTELTLINSVRLGPEGERELEALGTPKHLLRIGTAHGMDDPYFMHRYPLTLWAPPGMRHGSGLRTQEELGPTHTPIAGARAFVFEKGKRSEAAILLANETLVSCDSYQNWESYEGASLLGKAVLSVMGFSPTLIGGPWAKLMGPAIREDFARLREQPFRHLIPGHGQVLRDRAREGLDVAIRKRFG